MDGRISDTRIDRRNFMRLAAMGGAAALLPAGARRAFADGAAGPATQPIYELAKFPEKTNLLLLTDRPPQLETPLRYFRKDLTPNDAFFVRWHLAQVPTRVDTDSFTLTVRGHVAKELDLSLEDLRKDFDPVSLIAVNQCSGNSRALFHPRVLGGQWGNGAMGNAKWTGVRLKDVLARAQVKKAPVDVSFSGLDRAPLPSVPAFVKSLDFEHANDGEVMIAYEQNGEPLPMLNGFPLRLIVPGWFGTYWVKALNEITVLPEKFKGFWMDKAYRVPKNPQMEESPTDLAKVTVPISSMLVRSLFVRPEPDEKIAAGGGAVEVEGIAFDGGKGIKMVEVSADEGKSWSEAMLDAELGKYSWRRWRYSWQPSGNGRHILQARATNVAGEEQQHSQWNRSGYARNVIESVAVHVE